MLPATYEIDHIIALYLGGTNERDNLQAACANCHRAKTVDEKLRYEEQLRVRLATADASISASRRAVAASKLPKVTKSPYFGTDSPLSVSTPDELAGQLARLGIIVRKSTRG